MVCKLIFDSFWKWDYSILRISQLETIPTDTSSLLLDCKPKVSWIHGICYFLELLWIVFFCERNQFDELLQQQLHVSRHLHLTPIHLHSRSTVYLLHGETSWVGHQRQSFYAAANVVGNLCQVFQGELCKQHFQWNFPTKKEHWST